jgi:hypothetical protein
MFINCALSIAPKEIINRSIIHENQSPTMLLGATHAPLDHYFILKIFLEYF